MLVQRNVKLTQLNLKVCRSVDGNIQALPSNDHETMNVSVQLWGMMVT